MRRKLMRAGSVLTFLGLIVFGLAAPASAHVTVNPSAATQGSYSKVSFRVPNEKDDAPTVKLELFLPPETPVASVTLKPTPGWSAVTEKSKLATPIKTHDSEITVAVTKITWTAAEGQGIAPGQFQEFDVSLGPLPETDQIVFKALQTYSDGDIVRWIDPPKADGSEPEHPAPVLKLAKGNGDAHGAAGTETEADAHADDSGSGLGAGIWLGIAGVALGMAGLVTGLLAYRQAVTRT